MNCPIGYEIFPFQCKKVWTSALVFYTFSKKPKKNLQAAKAKTDKMQGSMATTTKLVKSIFDLMFKEQIDEDDTKGGGGGRRRRCGNCDVSIAQYPSCLGYSNQSSCQWNSSETLRTCLLHTFWLI